MRILVTGGAGFIGTHVTRMLAELGHDVLALDTLRPDVHRHQAPAIPQLIRADVRDGDAVAAALRGVHAVAHLAAKVGLGVGMSDLEDYVASNDLGTAVLLREMAGAGTPRLVLASSMVVYGEGGYRCAEHGRVPAAARTEADLAAGCFEPRCPHCHRRLDPTVIGEDAALDPRNGYAAIKVAQEHLAAIWARQSAGTATALRFHNVYGPGLPCDTPYAGVAALFLSALRSGTAPRVFEDGGQRRDFVHVRDVAGAVAVAIGREDGGTLRPYNVGSGRVTTVGELAGALARATGGPAPVVTGDYRLGDVRHITASSRRIAAELGWAATTDLAQGLAELATPVG